MTTEPPYLYLTTTGHISGNPHQIEIWFVEHEGRYYMISERGQRAHWIQNIQHNPAVVWSVGSRDAAELRGTGRMVDPTNEPALSAAIRAKMTAKYNWADGWIMELDPQTE